MRETAYNVLAMEKGTDHNDYNNIREWLVPLLEKRGLTVERFAKLCGTSRASIYFYCQDRTRPTEKTMAVMCRVLDRPLEEGLRQYTPKKAGRPKGYFPVHSVSARLR